MRRPSPLTPPLRPVAVSALPGEGPDTRAAKQATAVPVTGVFGREERAAYLAELRAGSGKWRAARAVGVSIETVRKLRRSSPDFAEAEADAVYESVDRVQDRLYAAALEGQPWAVAMVLKRLGPAEVWNPPLAVDVAVSGTVGLVGAGGGAGGVDGALVELLEGLRAKRRDLLEVTGREVGGGTEDGRALGLGRTEGGIVTGDAPALPARVPGALSADTAAGD